MLQNRTNMLHTVQGMPVIGYTFAIELKSPMYERNTVVELAEKFHFSTKEFPEPTKRNSFKNAMRTQMKKGNESDKILHFVEETSTNITFQVDKKVLESCNLFGNSSDGGQTEIESMIANYSPIFQVVYDKTTDRVICQNNEVLMEVYKCLGVYMESYTKQTLTRYIRNLLERNTNFIPYIKGTGVYFVPAYQKNFLDRVINFMYELDNVKNTTLCEIPALPNAETVVAKSVVDSFIDMKNNQRNEIEKLIAENGHLTEKMKENRLAEIAKRGEVITQYEILLGKELAEAKESTKATEMMIKNYYKFGVLENPFQKIIDENKGNAEVLNEIKATLPDDILELVTID